MQRRADEIARYTRRPPHRHSTDWTPLHDAQAEHLIPDVQVEALFNYATADRKGCAITEFDC